MLSGGYGGGNGHGFDHSSQFLKFYSTFIQYKSPEGFHVMKFIYAHPVPGDQKRQWYSISLKQPADRFDLLATLRGHTAFRTYPPP